MADFVGADRGLKRLKVTCIDLAQLEQPTVVTSETSASRMLERRSTAAREESAVVVDDDGHLRGYLMRSRAFGDGTVADRVRRLDAWVRSDATLKDAFSEMLLHDAGWVAVLDHDDRFLGVLTPDRPPRNRPRRRESGGALGIVDRSGFAGRSARGRSPKATPTSSEPKLCFGEDSERDDREGAVDEERAGDDVQDRLHRDALAR